MIPSASSKAAPDLKEHGRRSSTEARGDHRGLHFFGPLFNEKPHLTTSRVTTGSRITKITGYQEPARSPPSSLNGVAG
jgi:hypothetical protein